MWKVRSIAEGGNMGREKVITIPALSVKQPFASEIASGKKVAEFRSWATKYRGPLLIVSSKRPEVPGLPCGQAVAVVQLVSSRRSRKDDECRWILWHPRPIDPFPVVGRPGLFPVTLPEGLEIENLGVMNAEEGTNENG
jgi:hypothetical protein